KIILRKPETYQTRNIDAAAAGCLKYLESKIDVVLLDEFKQTKRRNYEWEGNTDDKSLYNAWHQIASDVEGLPKLVSEDPALENDIQTPPVSSLNASILTDMLPVDKPKEVPVTSNDSNTALATTSRPDKALNICPIYMMVSDKNEDRRKAYEKTVQYWEKNKQRFDQNKNDKELNIGDEIFVESGDKLNRGNLNEVRKGPFQMVEKISPIMYRLRSNKRNPLANIVHKEKLVLSKQ
ncbi:hypothetical protein RN001_000279, partial [Aquatica leii]